MPRYGRDYDYGLRGPRQTWGPQMPDDRRPYPPGARTGEGYRTQGGRHYGPLRRGRAYDYDYGYRGAPPHPGMPHHVTQRYNLDYVFPELSRPSVNYHRYGGDVEGRIGDMHEYARPYYTIGGTRTYRGADRPMGWEYGPTRYGPDYYGRW